MKAREKSKGRQILFSMDENNPIIVGHIGRGIPEENIEIILDENEALRKVLQQACSADTIAVFFEKMGPLVELLKKYEAEASMRELEDFLLTM
jgi:cyanophycin synthetase